MQNLVPAQQEKKPVEVIDFNVNRAKNALTDKLIENCTEEEIKPKLLLIYSMVGLRVTHYPQGQEKQDLHDYIRLKYGKKTLSEFVLAFDLAINNELDLKTDDIKIYDQFTISYLAMVMSAYKSWLNKIWQTNKSKPAIIELEEKKEVSDEEKLEWLNEWKRDDIIVDLIPIHFYDYLIQFNLVEITPKIKWEAIERATQSIKSSLQVAIGECKTTDALREFGEFEKMEKDGFTGKLKEQILNKAKKLIIADYLKSDKSGQ